MIKLARDQPFHWFEPFAFSRARAAATHGASKLPLLLLFSALLAAPLVLADTPENLSDIGLVAVFAIGMALVITYLFIPIFSRLPNDVLVESDRIVIGRESVPFFDIQYAIVGTSAIGGKEFSVLTFRTKGGQDHMYGLVRKVSAKELAYCLDRSGVREPQA